MTRDELLKLWDDAWTEGLWAASWGRSIEGLTPEQAAWTPAPGRHSIWQIVLHLCFWRDATLPRMRGQPGASDEAIARENYPTIDRVTAEAWAAARQRLRESQSRIHDAIGDSAYSTDLVIYMITHDNYHFGQINYLRAMQGLKPIE
jgi:uncharacterized damage-inducible protein DinB